MKQYGANKSTEFTKKQIGVIYRLAKTGELKVEKGEIKNLYDLADYYGYDDNRAIEEAEGHVLRILKAVFDRDLEKAQELLDKDSERSYSLLSRKNQQAWDKSFL